MENCKGEIQFLKEIDLGQEVIGRLKIVFDGLVGKV